MIPILVLTDKDFKTIELYFLKREKLDKVDEKQVILPENLNQ